MSAKPVKQTNKINGENLIDLASGRQPALGLVGLGVGGSPNQKLEARVCLFGDAVRRKDANDSEDVGIILLHLIQDQERTGFMSIEPATNSHAVIWQRAMVGLKLFTVQARSRGGVFAQLDQAVSRWHRLYLNALALGYVPSGPLAGQILLPCGRAVGFAKGQPGTLTGRLAGTGGEPGTKVRDVYYSLLSDTPEPAINGRRDAVKVGKLFWSLSKDRQDDASGPLAIMVLAKGGFDLPVTNELPRFVGTLRVVRGANGHDAAFDSLPGVSDAALTCRVDYASGDWSFEAATGALRPGSLASIIPAAGKES